MKRYIYESKFKTGPEATKKQQMLFSTDTNYALSEGYNYIQDSEGLVFKILDEENLVKVEVTEEILQETLNSPETIEFDPTDLENEESEDYYMNCHNLMLIDNVINNTLLQKESLTPQQTDTMLKLAKLKQMLKESF